MLLANRVSLPHAAGNAAEIKLKNEKWSNGAQKNLLSGCSLLWRGFISFQQMHDGSSKVSDVSQTSEKRY